MRKYLTSFLTIIFVVSLNAQVHDKGEMKKGENKFWDEIKSSLTDYNKTDKPDKMIFQVDLSNFNIPESIDDFKQYWHNEPVSQARTNTCWSYSTTSFLESEIYRLNGKKIKLSPLWTAYWEVLEKATEYVKTRGESLFDEGSEANAVTRIWKKYGVVPYDAYSGLLPGQPFPDHEKMYEEMKGFLATVKKDNAWNLDNILETLKCIMNNYNGVPPTKFEYEGKEYSPKEFLKDVVQLNLDDYIDVVNYMQEPFWQNVEYKVPDNWWHSKEYYNVPLETFMNIINYTIENGYTLSIGGDVSESGKVAEKDVFVVPSYDIPSDYIDDYAKQFRFSNKTTTDDHGIHMVGYKDVNNVRWYLIKDSGSSSRNGRFKGYYLFHEDYVKLKMMDFMVHKDCVKKWIKK
jgi:bleomycin hydrolase